MKPLHATFKTQKCNTQYLVSRFISDYDEQPYKNQGRTGYPRYDQSSTAVIRGYRECQSLSSLLCQKGQYPRVRNDWYCDSHTPRGTTGFQAKEAGVCGEVLCYVW